MLQTPINISRYLNLIFNVDQPSVKLVVSCYGDQLVSKCLSFARRFQELLAPELAIIPLCDYCACTTIK